MPTQNLVAGALAAALGTALSPAVAAVQITAPDTVYLQDFDTLANSGTNNAWVNDATLPGWSLFTAAGTAVSSYAADTGGSNAGAFKSLGTSGSAERALGGVGSGGSYFGSPASGALAGWTAVAFDNATGSDLLGFTLGFAGEQWRNGGNTSAQTMTFEYGLGSAFDTVASWLSPGAGFDWASPVTGSSSGAVDGNTAGRVDGLGGSVALDWAAGQTLWLRWAEVNDFGSDHALAIDDLSFSVTAVPEPGTYALLLSGLLAMGAFVRRRG
jgi:hypothetical protein